MTKARRSFRREDPENRKESLIRATLALMAARGPSAATVRAIAQEAGVTQGMIRHYFTSKEELVNAAYLAHMQDQTEASEGRGASTDSAQTRLAMMVAASVTPPVADPRALSLWAGFMHLVWRDPSMLETHKRTYLHYRNRLQAIIIEAMEEVGRGIDQDGARSLAIACNAVIDGLWLEGGALPGSFREGELARIGLQSVGAILGLTLKIDEVKE